MRFFLRTRKFKICVIFLALVLAVSIGFKVFSGVISAGSGVFGVIAAPFQKLISDAGDSFKEFSRALNDGNKLIIENKKLEEELNNYNKVVAENNQLKLDNEFYKNYLEIKDTNPDFEFCPADIITRDNSDPYCSFTLNKGSVHGLKQYDPVISGNYLVGYIESVGITTSKVSTLLNPKITLGVNDSRTNDPGLITGAPDFAEEGKTKLYNLSRDCNVAVGDYIISSGEGVFPKGLLIGTVENIKSDNYTFSNYASVMLFADLKDIKNVMVITDFSGQSLLADNGE